MEGMGLCPLFPFTETCTVVASTPSHQRILSPQGNILYRFSALPRSPFTATYKILGVKASGN